MDTTPLPLPSSRFRLHSEDPAFRVQWRGGARFALSGEVAMEPSAALDVETPGDALAVSLARHSRAEHAVRQLRRALPRHVLLQHTPVPDGVEIVFQEALVPAAKAPRLRLLSSDPTQRVLQLEDNRVEFVGAASGDHLLTLLCDARRVTVQLPAGSSAQASAARVGAHVPHGYRALIDGPVVSVWKDADFFSMVA